MKVFITAMILLLSCSSPLLAQDQNCLIGAFITDRPTIADIDKFQRSFGKSPALVLVFVDWGNFIDKKVLEDVYARGSKAVVTWEPWFALQKKGINPDELLSGKYDAYVSDFARQMKELNAEVFVRFGHEMNSNWYPWGEGFGADKYVSIARYIHQIFQNVGAVNVRWIFAVNWEDVPKVNGFEKYYPGDTYVDYIGIDGYNWGSTQSWSRWQSFREIFRPVHAKIIKTYQKPILISEFSSAGKGGDKAAWIRDALGEMKGMERVSGFILFNQDKEVDWAFVPGSPAGKQLKKQLKDVHFRGGDHGN